MQASSSFELAREGRSRPTDLHILGTPSHTASAGSTAAVIDASRSLPASALRRRGGSSDQAFAKSSLPSPSFNASLSLSHQRRVGTDEEDVFARPTGKPHAMVRSGSGILTVNGLPPTPLTASNAEFAPSSSSPDPSSSSSAKSTVQLPGFSSLFAGVSAKAPAADNCSFVRSTRPPLHEFDVQPLELRSPLDVKNRVGYVGSEARRSSPSSLMSSMTLAGGTSPAGGMTQSKSGEFEGPRAEWVSPTNSLLLMGVRAPSPLPHTSHVRTGAASDLAHQPRDGDVVGLGLELGPEAHPGETTPRASAAHGRTARDDSSMRAGIPFMPPRMPGAPKLGSLESGRFEDRTVDLMHSPIKPPLAASYDTRLTREQTVSDAITVHSSGGRAAAMEREQTVQLAGQPVLRGLGISMPGGAPLSKLPLPLPLPSPSTRHTGLTPTMERPGFFRQNSAASDATERDAQETPCAPSSSRMGPSRASPTKKSVSGAHLYHSSPRTAPPMIQPKASTPSSLSSAEPGVSARAQSKMRSQQLIDTAMSSIAAVNAVQSASRISNTAASVLSASPTLRTPGPSSSSDGSSPHPSAKGSKNRPAGGRLDQEMILADSSPWGVFSVNKGWRPLAPPGIKATAFVKKQQQHQSTRRTESAATAANQSPSKSSRPASGQSAKKQRTVLGVKNVNAQETPSPTVPAGTKIAAEKITADRGVPPRKRSHDRASSIATVIPNMPAA